MNSSMFVRKAAAFCIFFEASIFNRITVSCLNSYCGMLMFMHVRTHTTFSIYCCYFVLIGFLDDGTNLGEEAQSR